MLSITLCYVAEAHGNDEWPISSSRATKDGAVVDVPQTTTAAARRTVAQRFEAEYLDGDTAPVRVVVDDPATDAVEKTLAPWPVRFYLVRPDGVLDFVADPSECQLDWPDMEKRARAMAAQR